MRTNRRCRQSGQRALFVAALIFIAPAIFAQTTTSLVVHVTRDGQPVSGADVIVKDQVSPYQFDKDRYNAFTVAARGSSDLTGVCQLAPIFTSQTQVFYVSAISGLYGIADHKVALNDHSTTLSPRPLIVIEGKLVCPEDPTAVVNASITMRGAGTLDLKPCEAQPLPVAPNGDFTVHVDPIDESFRNARYLCALFAESGNDFGGVGPIFPNDFKNWRPEDRMPQKVTIQLKRLVSGIITLVDQNEAPLPDQWIRMMPDLPLGGRNENSWGPFAFRGKTDSSGNCQFHGIWPGSLLCTIGGNAVDDVVEMDLTSATSPVQKKISLKTLAGEVWSGVITDALAHPLQDALVEYRYPVSGGEGIWSVFAFTDVDGRYRFESFPAMPWDLAVFKPGYIPVGWGNADNGGIPPGVYSYSLRPFGPGSDVTTESLTRTERYWLESLDGFQRKYGAQMKKLKATPEASTP